jgi:hypothetical protein
MAEEKVGVVACQYDDPYSNVNLVDRDPNPSGYELVDPDRSGKKNQFDLVELAARIQTADQVSQSSQFFESTLEKLYRFDQQGDSVLVFMYYF